VPNILTSDESEKSNEELMEGDGEDDETNKLTYDDFRLTKENNSDENLINSLDSKDKRRHYLIKSKQFLHLGKKVFFMVFLIENSFLNFLKLFQIESQQTISASPKLWSSRLFVLLFTIVAHIYY
jgi:hypothetical protein